MVSRGLDCHHLKNLDQPYLLIIALLNIIK